MYILYWWEPHFHLVILGTGTTFWLEVRQNPNKKQLEELLFIGTFPFVFRVFAVASAIGPVTFLLLQKMLLLESPLYHYAKGDVKQAETTLTSIARLNKVSDKNGGDDRSSADQRSSEINIDLPNPEHVRQKPNGTEPNVRPNRTFGRKWTHLPNMFGRFGRT